jgi:hypothetical protein
LGAGYAAGIATVDPKRFPETCKHCHLTPLCRIAEKHAAGVSR